MQLLLSKRRDSKLQQQTYFLMPHHIKVCTAYFKRIPRGDTLYRIFWMYNDIQFTNSGFTEQKISTILDQRFVLPNVKILATNSYNESYLASIVATSKKGEGILSQLFTWQKLKTIQMFNNEQRRECKLNEMLRKF